MLKKETVKIAKVCIEEGIASAQMVLKKCEDHHISGDEVVSIRRSLTEMQAALRDLQWHMRLNDYSIQSGK